MSAIEAPFLITVALGDGTSAQIPATDHAELGRLVGRMAAACVRGHRPFPAIEISGPDGPDDRPRGERDLHPPADER